MNQHSGEKASERAARVDRDRSAEGRRDDGHARLRYEEDSRDAEMPGGAGRGRDSWG